jgi:hypothetical protein
MKELTDLEIAVLDKLLAGEDSNLAILRSQLANVDVTHRENTGVGFYVHFFFPSEIERLPNRDRIIFGDVNAEVEGLKFGAGFLLFISDGAIKMLEGYSYEEPWPTEIKKFVLRYADGFDRNLNEVAGAFASKAGQSAKTK